jgi:hypothetical protein
MVAAEDAAPDVSLDVPGNIEVDSILTLHADADDDVAVSEVQFYLDGAILGTRKTPPYEMAIAATEQMANRSLKVGVIAVDSVGQSSALVEKNVSVQAQVDRTVPELTWESPIELQRIVEGAPLRIQLVREIDIDDTNRTDGIRYINFFIDGAKAGSAYFPRLEERELPTPTGTSRKVWFEIWRLDTKVNDFIATNETSFAVHGEIYAANGGQGSTAARLIRIIRNQPPTIKMLSPTSGDIISVGQQLPIQVEFSDDTLALGSVVELLVNGDSAEIYQFKDTEKQYNNAIEALSSSKLFTLPIIEEQLGQTLKLQARVTDFHGEISLSELIRLPVKEDQPPSVALSHPTEGMSLVAGQVFELRANANDDINVSRVDFYIDDRLVGTDASAPYAFT